MRVLIFADLKLRIWSHLLKKSLMENFTFCAAGENVFCSYFSSFVSQFSSDKIKKLVV